MRDGVLLAVLLAAALAFSLAAISSRIREAATAYWLAGWSSLLLTGGLFIVSESGLSSARFVAYLTDAVVAPLMLMGAFRLRDIDPRGDWPIVVGFAAGLLRVGFDLAGAPSLVALLCATVTPAFLIASAVVMTGAVGAPYRHPIALLFVAFAAVDAYDAWLDWSSTENTIPWIPVMGAGISLAGFQMASRLLALGGNVESANEASNTAERERDLERGRLELIFDHVEELVVEISDGARIFYVNRRVQEWMGLEPGDLIGRTALDFLPPERRAEAIERFRLLVKSGRPVGPKVLPVIRPSGEIRSVEVTVSEFRTPSERRFLVLARDVTKRLEIEEELEAYRYDLERLVEERSAALEASRERLRDQGRLAAVGTLASGIAHQVNNPVGAISAAAEFALLSGEGSEAEKIRRTALERIVEESSRIGRIVKSITRFARHDKTQKWPEDLWSVVHRSVTQIRAYVAELGGEIDLEGAQDRIEVAMSPIEIEQVMVNLIRNAAESKEGGAKIEVRVLGEGESAVVEVTDDGLGISQEIRSSVFDPFFTTRLREGGSGLGLAVAHGIATDHGGRIEILDAPHGGTTMRLTLPRWEVADETA